MFFNIKKYPEYINKEIEKEIETKWFSVYNYIDLRELILTTRKDFLDILSTINIPFAIISIILWVVWYYSGSFFLLPIFLFWAYFLIFIILFFKLLFKTKLFLYISDVVYTKVGLMLSNDFLYYKKDSKIIQNKLDKYSYIFSEYLWKPSFLKEVIIKKKKEILDSTFNKSWTILKVLSDLWRSRNWGWLALVLLVSSFLYILSLYIFYYIWYFFLFLFGKIYIFFLKILLSFKKNIELKIKEKTIQIDNKIEIMNLIYKVLKDRIDTFKSGKISDIWDFIDEKFTDFYTQISLILDQKNKLQKIIVNSKYKDFIDFNVFKNYLRNNFNKPVLDMISLLEVYEKMVSTQISKLQKLSSNSVISKEKLDINNTEILDENLKQKIFILNKKLEILSKNKKMLENSLI